MNPVPVALFPIAHCPTCARDVLLHETLDAASRPVTACLHCDAVLVASSLLDADQVDELGYFVDDGRDKPKGDRGCRGGTCGIQQPEG